MSALHGASVPVTVLTGCLGSGKTTLLNTILNSKDASNIAVIINEYGDIALDQFFLEAGRSEVAVLPNGCLCCLAKDDLADSLVHLFSSDAARARRIDRVIIETSGLADPGPVAQLVLNLPIGSAVLALDTIVTAVDAVHIGRQAERHIEAARQIAFADTIVVTKLDMPEADPYDVQRLLSHYNRHAAVTTATRGALAQDCLFTAEDGFRLAARPVEDEITTLRAHQAQDCTLMPDHMHEHTDSRDHTLHEDVTGHSLAGVHAFSIIDDEPIEWPVVEAWLRRLRRTNGDHLLRIKGVVSVKGADAPFAVHAIHHVIHPPQQLSGWSGTDRRTKLVFITDGLREDEIRRQWSALRTAAPDRAAALYA